MNKTNSSVNKSPVRGTVFITAPDAARLLAMELLSYVENKGVAFNSKEEVKHLTGRLQEIIDLLRRED